MADTPALRIGGWLLAPLAWLLMTLLSITLFLLVQLSPQARAFYQGQSEHGLALWLLSLVCALAMWGYSLWLSIAFFKRRQCVPRHYIIWLLLTVLLGLKTFAFTPVSDELALRQLLFPLLAAALLVPYFRRSTRVRQTFVTAR